MQGDWQHALQLFQTMKVRTRCDTSIVHQYMWRPVQARPWPSFGTWQLPAMA